MLNILKNWWNKPWTNGTCIKWGLYGTLLSGVIVFLELAWLSNWTVFKKK